jgi:outer membrane protein assembly factor BamB
MSSLRAARFIAVALALAAGGCKTVTDTYDRWFGSGRPAVAQKPAELVTIRPTAGVKVMWQASVGSADRDLFFPAVSGGVVYAAGAAGQIAGFDAGTGRPVMRAEAGQRLSGGVGVGQNLVLVGTPKGEVLAYGREGKLAWRAQLSSAVLAPPQAASGLVVARAGDGRIYGLDAANGTRRWLYQRATPALSVRSHAGAVVFREGVYAGFPGGRLIALALGNGSVGWEGIVALPRGATELERVADITSLPIVDERQACAVAFQGRIACFDAKSGTSLWARDVSSVAGMGADARNFYVTDDRNAVVALDRTTGASVWRQDRLFGRGVSTPLAFGRYVVVGDFQGYVHILSREDGAFAARIATDGSAIGAAPVALDLTSFVVQTRNGGVFAIAVQ